MDNTNPDNLAACFAPIDFAADSSNNAKSAKTANNKVWACVKDSVQFGERPSHFECKRAAQKIKSDNNLKQDIYKFCNENYYQSMTCVKEAKLIEDKITAAEAAAKKTTAKSGAEVTSSVRQLQEKLKKTVRECVLDNSTYFENDFCIHYIKDAGMLEDKELSKACLNETKKNSSAGADSQK